MSNLDASLIIGSIGSSVPSVPSASWFGSAWLGLNLQADLLLINNTKLDINHIKINHDHSNIPEFMLPRFSESVYRILKIFPYVNLRASTKWIKSLLKHKNFYQEALTWTTTK